LQVHPTTDYIRQNFGMAYTQDESYYLLDADEKEDTYVYLGLKTGVDSKQMLNDLRRAQKREIVFPAEEYVNKIPVKKHDHILIPAGTIHCSGKNTMVLEISATPYIFTFKLWDWGRLGLDGLPRPIHIDHGEQVIRWDRDTEWVKQNLVNRFETISADEDERIEKTGLHELEFIETIRRKGRRKMQFQTAGSVNMLNLIEGKSAVVESPTNAFAPFVVHYAETFILPASVGEYTIAPYETDEVMVICASVRG
jgi:mannose-6-phosphate isomerase class I